MLLLLAAAATAGAAPPCPATLPPAPVVVAGFGTSMSGCIGAQRSDATRTLAWTVDCSSAGLNITRAAEQTAALCASTPGCAAFSIDSPALGKLQHPPGLMCEIHPDTIAQGSEPNLSWNVWQKDGSPKAGKWPHSPPPPPDPLVWTTPSSSVAGSMPLGNGKLGVNVWADATDTVWLLLSHVDALDENTNLDKLGRVAVRATTAANGNATRAAPAQSFRAAPAQSFRQEMHLTNATVTIDLPSGVHVHVWVDATTDAVRVASSGSLHKLEATLEVWRNVTAPMDWCPGQNETSRSDVCPMGELQGCASLHPGLTLSADTIKGQDDAILFYHRNPDTEGWAIDLKSQVMPPDLPSPMTNITFGGFLTGGAGSKMVRTGMQLVSQTAATTQRLSIGGTAGRFDDDGVATFTAEVVAAAAKPASREAHEAVWSEFWAASDITITAAASPADAAVASNAARVTLMDKVTRASSHFMARGQISGIHSQAYGIFSAYDPPREDYRIWGPCQWFQNMRLPYYHMLADGRFEDMKSLFEFYHRVLNVSIARTKTWYNISEGTFFPETMRQSGLYDSGEMGMRCQSAQAAGKGGDVPVASNPYIRYHREGGLELSLLALDWLDHSQDLGYFQRILLPQIVLYLDYYANHFGNGADGRLDIYPSQALETWQCTKVPPTRDSCVTNPMPKVAGLHALMPRLLALNESVVPDAATRAKWQALAKRVPELPVGPCMQGPGKGNATCLLPGAQLPPVASNSENADLYAVHPYRVVGLYANRSLGKTTYDNRYFKGNTGWSEDLMDAALLGLTSEAVPGLIVRANLGPATSTSGSVHRTYRWIGFQGGIGTGGTATDHGAVGAAGLRYMLLHSGTSDEQGVPSEKIVLFPAWPCDDWAVDFRLHAPGKTIVEGSYDGAGKLSNFSVSPEDRRADVVFAGCVKSVDE